MINKDRILKTLTFVNIHKHIKALFIIIIRWLGNIDKILPFKADLVNGKVPAEQLPSYVDDVVDITSFVTESELKTNIGKANYTNKTFFCNSPTNSTYYNKIINTNNNTAESDWTITDPEDGKIYINEYNNHSYRWSGSSLVDLDKNFNDRITALENKAPICNLSGVTNRYDLSTATSGIDTLYNALKKGDAAIGAIIKFTTTDNNIYYARIVYINYVDTANEPINIIIENNECRQSYDITNIITLLYNDATLNFSSSNMASNVKECKKIIKNKTTAHIFYNNIIMQQVDLSSESSIKFIGYTTNGLLNYYGCNINTGSIISYNTYNISKTCLYKTYTGQLLTENEIKNVREQQRTLYFLTDSAEDRLAQITAYNLTSTTNKGYPCVFTINSLTYEGFCFVSSVNEINFVTINKYTIYGWVINATTGVISSSNTANLLEMFNLSSYKYLGGNKTNINNLYSELINILWGNTINLTQSQIDNIPSDIVTKLPNVNRINFILDDNNIIVFNRGYYESSLYYFYCIFNDNTLYKLIYNSTNNDMELTSVTIGSGGSESSDMNIVTITSSFGFDTETDQKIQNSIGVIFNNNLFTKTTTNNGSELHFVLLEESLDVSELIYNIASKSFTINNNNTSVLIDINRPINKPMNDITINDIFVADLLQSVNFVRDVNVLNISVTSSDIKTEYIKLLSCSLSNTNSINILFTFKDNIFYITTNGTTFDIKSSKTIQDFIGLPSSGGGVN